MSKMSSWRLPEKRLKIVIKQETDHLYCPILEVQTDTWGLITKTLNQQDRKIRKQVGQIKSKWRNTTRLPRRELVEKLSRSKSHDLSDSDLSKTSICEGVNYKLTPRTSSMVDETFGSPKSSFYLPGSGSVLSSISFTDIEEEGASGVTSDQEYLERQQLRREIEELRKENKRYLAERRSIDEQRQLLHREKQIMALERKKMKLQLNSSTSQSPSPIKTKLWPFGRTVF